MGLWLWRPLAMAAPGYGGLSPWLPLLLLSRDRGIYWHGSEFRSDTSIVRCSSDVVRMAWRSNAAAHHHVVLPQGHVHVSVSCHLTTCWAAQQRRRSTVTWQQPVCSKFITGTLFLMLISETYLLAYCSGKPGSHRFISTEHSWWSGPEDQHCLWRWRRGSVFISMNLRWSNASTLCFCTTHFALTVQFYVIYAFSFDCNP